MVIAKDLKRKTLLTSLLSITSIIIITLSYFNSLKLNKKNIHVTEQLNEISITLDQINVLEKDFLDFETTNPIFHKTGKSKVLNKVFNKFREVEQLLNNLSCTLGKSSSSEEILINLQQKINQHSRLFDTISISIKERGYKDFGLEGEMRKEIHFVEKNSPYPNLSMILMLRRHEKDFFLRKETQYVNKVHNQIQKLKLEINNTTSGSKEKKIYNDALDNYLLLFNQIVDHERNIGIRRNLGLSGKINEQFNKITADISEVKEQVHHETKSKLHISQTFYFVALFILLTVILLSFLISRQLGKPIERLSQSIQDAIKKDFHETSKIYESKSQNEIAFIGQNVQKMLSKIILQKQFLTGKNIEVNEQNKELNEQKFELNNALKLIEQKNKNLTDSISYAQYIQDSFLPTPQKLTQIFKSHFVIYQPKDIVSGDFYLVDETENYQTVIVCDCTGHGVPGAFMTLLGNMLLDDSVKRKHIISPNEILEHLDNRILELLGGQNQLNSEGMDISICIINKITQELTYSGARSPLLISQKNEWNLIKGVKRSIGDRDLEDIPDRQFINHTFKLETGDRFFLWTDGYKDQFGGALNKKIGSKRLENIIKVNTHEKPKDIGKILEREIKAWRTFDGGVYDQIDDILVVGIEVDFK